MTEPTSAAPNADGEGGTVWRRIADELAQAIEREDYRPGDTLPASVALAERYGVHRHTVRQAFRHLADLGLVTVARGRGTQVSARRVPYPIGRRVSMRTNFGKLGIVGTSRVLSTGQAVGEAGICAMLGVADGAPLWRLEGLSLADGTPMGTGTHWLPVARFAHFDEAYREAELLAIAPGAPVMVSTAVDALPDLTPIHVVVSVFAGERMEMVVEPFEGV